MSLKYYTVIVYIPDALFFENGERATRLEIVEAENAKEAIETAETNALVSLVHHDELDEFEEENGVGGFEALYCFEGKLTNLA